jgi:hypothetical protein
LKIQILIEPNSLTDFNSFINEKKEVDQVCENGRRIIARIFG